MPSFLRRNACLVSVAILSVSAGLTGPAIGHGIQHALFAHNSDKVDGKHAASAGATINDRKGKLVATSPRTGRLPDNIVSHRVTFPNAVPVGVTVKGRWGFDADGDGTGDHGISINYPAPMPVPLNAHVLLPGAASTPSCPGTVDAPAALPGILCIYIAAISGGSNGYFQNNNTEWGTNFGIADDGIAGDIYAHGTWAAQPATGRVVVPRSNVPVKR